ncbi:MAG: hypothetical protein MUO87_06175, partial [Thermoplasmata archaeon]|nr:hypothetical protein [Thermoplasmata archaeon]
GSVPRRNGRISESDFCAVTMSGQVTNVDRISPMIDQLEGMEDLEIDPDTAKVKTLFSEPQVRERICL